MNEYSIHRCLARLLVQFVAVGCAPRAAQETSPADTLFTDVRVFDGASETLCKPIVVPVILSEGDPIADIDFIGDPERNLAVVVKDGRHVKGAP